MINPCQWLTQQPACIHTSGTCTTQASSEATSDSTLQKNAHKAQGEVDSLSTQLAKARASIAWLSAKLDDASDAVKRADDSRERWQERESAEEKAKDGALKAQQEALARESAERRTRRLPASG